MNNNVLFHRSSHQTNNFPSSLLWAELSAPPPSPGPWSPGPLVSVPSENIGWKNQHLSRWLFMESGPHSDHRWGPWGLTCHPGHYPCGHLLSSLITIMIAKHQLWSFLWVWRSVHSLSPLRPLSTGWAGWPYLETPSHITTQQHQTQPVSVMCATSSPISEDCKTQQKCGELFTEDEKYLSPLCLCSTDDLSISSGEKFYSGDNP